MQSRSDLAFLFPGQGSQSIGMLQDLAQAHAVVQKTFIEASGALDEDLWKIACEGPESLMNRTDYTQPLMLVAGVAVWRCWREGSGPRPAYMAGHSLGEYTALVCSGALNFSDGVSLVRDRGRYMQEAVPEGDGAIAAVLGLDDEQIANVCAQAAEGDVVEPVNFNSPGQVVIAGHTAAVNRALEQAKAAGAKRAVQLPMSVPAHCSLMRPAAEQLAGRLEQVDIQPAQIPVVHNVDVSLSGNSDSIKQHLVDQVRSPVRWSDCVKSLAEQGTTTAIECGPGRVLAGLNRRIDRAMSVYALHDRNSLAETLTAMEV